MPSIEFVGDDLLSIAVAEIAEIHRITAHLRKSMAWLEVVPGMDSIVVQFDATRLEPGEAQSRLHEMIEHVDSEFVLPDTLVEIPVAYGGEYGPDFDDVCMQLGLTAQELIERHTQSNHTVELVGFTPGFVYIGGMDERLSVPRHAQPRQHVAAGSVGIADCSTGIYALPSPGGWRLIGRTQHKMFDPHADEPIALQAGMRVRFVAVDESGT